MLSLFIFLFPLMVISSAALCGYGCLSCQQTGCLNADQLTISAIKIALDAQQIVQVVLLAHPAQLVMKDIIGKEVNALTVVPRAIYALLLVLDILHLSSATS